LRAPLIRFCLASLLALGLAACGAPASADPPAGAIPVQGVQVRTAYPHDVGAFTEGLLYLDGDIYESTGLEGRSDIRRVRLADGVVLQSQAIDPDLFGEGIVNWGDDLISLTWRDGVGFRWDRKTLTRKGSFRYRGEGWSLTQDGKRLIMSDGTPWLRFLDPRTLKETGRVKVTADGQPVRNLNELEWVKDEVLANIWLTHRIARIDPATGRVKGWIDLSSLPEVRMGLGPDAVANGIAYDAAKDRLFVTGKNWPHLYEIGLTGPKEAP
jgi:glutamine cyclotransferase